MVAALLYLPGSMPGRAKRSGRNPRGHRTIAAAVVPAFCRAAKREAGATMISGLAMQPKNIAADDIFHNETSGFRNEIVICARGVARLRFVVH
ncbi:MAG: hypothetical protein M9932_11510 [Xanthobacteraceae bacterium]|nr:hypothetical protein [Xanthobacteraceae bacterium]